MRSKYLAATALVALLGIAGCGGGPFEIAAVSGVVTLNGNPIENATVRFVPQRQGDGTVVGPSSVAMTDSKGRFSLKTDTGRSGAVVGNHIVSITTYQERMVDPAKSDEIEVLSEEMVPKRYRNPSELRFDVPNGGTKDATFALVSD